MTAVITAQYIALAQNTQAVPLLCTLPIMITSIQQELLRRYYIYCLSILSSNGFVRKSLLPIATAAVMGTFLPITPVVMTSLLSIANSP
jgi:hypothetical protein